MASERSGGFRRDLPDPPRQSEDNYASALAEVYADLDTAELVATDDERREFVRRIRDDIRSQLLEVLDDGE